MAGPVYDDEAESIDVTSLYGFKSRQGLVQITWPDGKAMSQLSPNAALQLARQLIECANNARTDELLARFLTVRLGQPIEMVAQIMRDMRELRAQLDDC